jgi:RNA polymerase sigma-70 factor (ECF subfamily)
MGVPLDSKNEQIHTLLAAKQWTEAFELVVANYQNKVFRLALSILGDRAKAEDAAQESFLRVWRGLPGFRSASSISTWIYSITRNTTLNILSAAANRPTLSLDQPSVRAVAESHKPSRAEPAEDLLDLVAQLPEKYRQVLILFYVEDKSYDQVAEILNLPLGTIKTNLYRARKEIAGALLRARMNQGGAPCGKP